jgi:hypothetical protein
MLSNEAKLYRKIVRKTIPNYIRNFGTKITTNESMDSRGNEYVAIGLWTLIDFDYRWSKLVMATKEEIGRITFKKDFIVIFKHDVQYEPYKGHMVRVIRELPISDKLVLADPQCFDKIKTFFGEDKIESTKRRPSTRIWI